MSRSVDAMPPGRCFHIASDLFFALNPGEKRFSGGSKIARTIYPHIEAAYRYGLEVGSCGDERDRKRIMRNIGKPKSSSKERGPRSGADKGQTNDDL